MSLQDFFMHLTSASIFFFKTIFTYANLIRFNYTHFEINGVSYNLIGSQECDFSTNLALRFVLKSHLLSTNHIRVLTSANQSYLIIGFKQRINFKEKCDMANEQKQKIYRCHE
jgi:hypothetical protein